MRLHLLSWFLCGSLVFSTQPLVAHEAKQHFDLGIQAFNQGNPQDAIAHLNQAIASYPDYAQALHARQHLLSAARLSTGPTGLATAIASYPGYAEAHYLLGLCLYQQQSFAAAEAAARQAVKVYPRY